MEQILNESEIQELRKCYKIAYSFEIGGELLTDNIQKATEIIKDIQEKYKDSIRIHKVNINR